MEEKQPRKTSDSWICDSPLDESSLSNFDLSYIEELAPRHSSLFLLHNEEKVNQEPYRVQVSTDSQGVLNPCHLIITNYRVIVQQIKPSAAKKNLLPEAEEVCVLDTVSLPHGFVRDFDLGDKEIKVLLKTGLRYQIRPEADISNIFQLILSQIARLPFCHQSLDKETAQVYDCLVEMERMGIKQEKFNVVDNNSGSICPTYPNFIILPKSVEQDLLEENLRIRNSSRIPVLAYYCLKDNAGIWRASRLKAGFENSKYSIAYNDSISSHLQVVDIRDEDIKDPHFRFEWLSALRNIFQDCILTYAKESKTASFLKASAKWFDDVNRVLSIAFQVVEKIKAGRDVLVQETGGFDRSGQISAVAQIIIDPFYRTFIGFSSLVEKEFVAFGHPFALRFGCNSEKYEEMSPIFIQFLECIHQLICAYPQSFQYSASYLARIGYEVYTTKYNNFQYNSCQERCGSKYSSRSATIWKNLPVMKEHYNYQWKQSKAKVELSKVRKKPSIKEFLFWKEYFELVCGMNGEYPDSPDFQHIKKDLYKKIHRLNSK